MKQFLEMIQKRHIENTQQVDHYTDMIREYPKKRIYKKFHSEAVAAWYETYRILHHELAQSETQKEVA